MAVGFPDWLRTVTSWGAYVVPWNGVYVALNRFNRVIFADTNPANVIQNAINNCPSGGIITIGPGTYEIDKQITIWGGVRLDCQNAILKNVQEDKWSPLLVFKQYARGNRIFVDANGGTGVLVGEEGKVCDSDIGELYVINAGSNYDPNLGPQYGVRFSGYSIEVGYIHVFQGNVGVDLWKTSDLKIDGVLVVDAVTGMRLAIAEHNIITGIDLDSCRYIGLQVDSSRDNKFFGTIWINEQAYPDNTLTYAILVGEYSDVDVVTGLDLNLSIMNTGGTALRVSNCKDSRFDLMIFDTDLFTGNTKTIQKAIDFGANLNGEMIFRGAISDTIPTKITGTPYGDIDIPGIGFNNGIATFSGDGVTTAFDILHEMPIEPRHVSITPRSADAAITFHVELVDTDGDGFNETIRVIFTSAPASGVDNIVMDWFATF